ncbi:MAG: glycoside hydrolase family 95 protein [Clostridiales bacterium]|nr:glycoside hydrolase family 95 protein [Clostridiales bacterium]
MAENRLIRDNQTLWYQKKAKQNSKESISQALPIACKSIWARLFGGTKKELIRLNHLKDLPENEKNRLDLFFDFQGIHSSKNYIRDLCLNDATANTDFYSMGTHHRRICFANYEENLLVYHITADKEKKISFKLKPDARKLNGSYAFTNNILTICYESENYFCCYAIKVENISGYSEHNSNSVIVSRADEATVYVLFEKGLIAYKNNILKTAVERLESSTQKGYDRILLNHLEDYREKFFAISFDIAQKEALCTTDKLLKNYSANKKELENLLFQYGRYISICSKGKDLSPEKEKSDISLDMYIKTLMPNLMSKMSPFDTNRCIFASGVMTEFLFDFKDGKITPLPQKRLAWADGCVCGINLADKFIADIKWQNYKVKNIKLKSIKGESFEMDISDFGKYDFKNSGGALAGLKIDGFSAHFDTQPEDVFEFFTNL